eukprot:IDg23092t1
MLLLKNGTELQLDEVAHAPTFKQNLLSVPQVTREDNCTVILSPRRGFVVRGELKPPRDRLITRLRRTDRLYTLNARLNRESGTANNVNGPARERTSIMQYFRHRKSVRRQHRLNQMIEQPLIITQQKVQTPQRPSPPTAHIAQKRRQARLTQGKFTHDLPEVSHGARAAVEAAHIWHLRLNHTSPDTIRIMAGMPEVQGLPVSLRQGRQPINCSGCAAGHSQRASHIQTTARPPAGHTLVADLAGPVERTDERFRYVLVITELHTRFRVARLLKRKSEAGDALLTVITVISRHFGHAPARLRVDNANELMTKDIGRYLQRRGIVLDPTTAHTPQENSAAERGFRTIFGRVRTTLAAAAMNFLDTGAGASWTPLGNTTHVAAQRSRDTAYSVGPPAAQAQPVPSTRCGHETIPNLRRICVSDTGAEA